ncbi:MAG: hypothetical protein ACRERV_06995 [Methylococcales bacterium]
MLKISTAQSSAVKVTLILEGRLLEPWVAELQSAITATGLPIECVHLNLSGLGFADSSGVEILRLLFRQGVHLQRLSPFMRELLSCRMDPGFADPSHKEE